MACRGTRSAPRPCASTPENASAAADARAEERARQEAERSEAPTRETMKVELKALEAVALGKTAYALLEYVYDKHTPRIELFAKNEAELRKKVKDANADTLKNVLRTALLHYHSDKNGGFDMKWRILCKEITKHLNGKYDLIKQG